MSLAILYLILPSNNTIATLTHLLFLHDLQLIALALTALCLPMYTDGLP